MAQGDNTSANDKDFVEFAGETNLTAVRLGRMAERQSSSKEVKQLGRTMVREHTQDLRKLRAVAKKVGAIAPNTLDDAHQQVVSPLANLKGEAFDRRFSKAAADQHAKAVDAYRREANGGFNSQLKAYAAATLPHLQEHLQQAQAMAGEK